MSDNTKVDLRPVTKDNWQAVMALEIEPEQANLVPLPAYFLAEAYIKPEGPERTYEPLAVYSSDNKLVGFLSVTCTPGHDRDYWINGVVIDRKYQSEGLGRAAMTAAIEYIVEKYPECIQIGLTVVPGNGRAASLYVSLGFNNTGEMYGGEVEWLLPIKR